MIDPKDAVTREEACHLLGVSLTTLRRMIRSKKLVERRYFGRMVLSRKLVLAYKKREGRRSPS